MVGVYENFYTWALYMNWLQSPLPSRDAEDTLKELDQKKKMLEREIKEKKITINIDRKMCLPIRAIFKFDMKVKFEKKVLL